MIETDLGGICSILQSDLADIPAEILADAALVIDEAHLLTNRSKLVKMVLQADRVWMLSATFGEELGLFNLREALEKKGAIVDTMKAKSSTSHHPGTKLHSLPWEPSDSRLTGGYAPLILESAAAQILGGLPTLVVADTTDQA